MRLLRWLRFRIAAEPDEGPTCVALSGPAEVRDFPSALLER
jgi:hypothetical protein